MIKTNTTSWCFRYLLLSFMLILVAAPARAVDVLNCSKCHQHKELKVLTNEGMIRDFHVNPDVFNVSAHSKLTCQTCHSYIKKTPHDPKNYRNVDCSASCHIEDEKYSKDYSHKREYNEYVRSTHGEANEDSIGCVACHVEHSERRSADFSPMDINGTCIACHEDTEMMAKHKISPLVIDSYKDSFHGKAANYGEKTAASCVSCHTTHDIRRNDDKKASTFRTVRNKTCQTEDCHPDAFKRFGEGVGHQLYRGKLGLFMKQLGFWTFITFLVGVLIVLLHYILIFLRKLPQEHWRYIAVFVYMAVLTVIAPYILRVMMQLKNDEIVFDIKDLSPEYKSFCRSCHGVYPHQKNLVLRAFMNRHSAKLACETCHIKRKSTHDNLEFMWYNGQLDHLFDFRGLDFDNGSKLMPYKIIGNRKVVIEMKKDGTLPLNYIVDKKGVDCVKCHDKKEKGIMDFLALSYSKSEAKNLRRLEEFEMLTKEKDWFIQILWDD